MPEYLLISSSAHTHAQVWPLAQPSLWISNVDVTLNFDILSILILHYNMFDIYHFTMQKHNSDSVETLRYNFYYFRYLGLSEAFRYNVFHFRFLVIPVKMPAIEPEKH
jgi:hypothetical protein